MKHSFLLTLLILISCGQEKRNDYEAGGLDKPVDLPKTEEKEPIGTGKITSIADGFDVERVNLFSSTSSDRTINCYLKNGDNVKVLEDADPYYLIEKADGQGCKGYCMKGFVILNK